MENIRPLIFDFSGTFNAPTFSVDIKVHASALVYDDDENGGVGMLGLVPSSVTGYGKDLTEAREAFWEGFRRVVEFCASENDSYESFVADFEGLNGPPPDHLVDLWNRATARMAEIATDVDGTPIVTKYPEREVIFSRLDTGWAQFEKGAEEIAGKARAA